MKKLSKKSQTSEVLQYMRTHKKSGISSMIAFELFGATRLSSIIFSLRNQGYEIDVVEDTTKTRYGRTVKYANYILVKEKGEK